MRWGINDKEREKERDRLGVREEKRNKKREEGKKKREKGKNEIEKKVRNK